MVRYLLLCIFLTQAINASSNNLTKLDFLVIDDEEEHELLTPRRGLSSINDVNSRLSNNGITLDLDNESCQQDALEKIRLSGDPELVNDFILSLISMHADGKKEYTLADINKLIQLAKENLELFTQAKDFLEELGQETTPFTDIDLEHINMPIQMGSPKDPTDTRIPFGDGIKEKNRGRYFGGHFIEGWNQVNRPIYCTVFENGLRKTISFRPSGKKAIPKTVWPRDVDSNELLRRYRMSYAFARQPGEIREIGQRCQLRMDVETGEIIAVGADDSQSSQAPNHIKTIFPFPVLPYPEGDSLMVLAKKSIQAPDGSILDINEDFSLTGSELRECLKSAQENSNKHFVDFESGTKALVVDITDEVHKKMGANKKPSDSFWMWTKKSRERRVKEGLLSSKLLDLKNNQTLINNAYKQLLNLN